MSARTIVIVGAGLAGSRCAERLRADGFDGRVVLVGDEPDAPYERPALSKEFLAGTREELDLRPAEFWAGARHRAAASSPDRAAGRARGDSSTGMR